VSKELHWVYYLWAKRCDPDAVGLGREILGDRYNKEEARLLYVGMTNDFPARIRQHLKDKDWALAIGEINLWVYPNRKEAEKAEIDAICEQHPLFNTMHTGMNTWRDTEENLMHKKGREEFMAEIGQWIPAEEDEHSQQILDLWRQQWTFADIDVNRFRRELRILTEKASKNGVEFSDIKEVVNKATSDALKSVEPIVYTKEGL
jgi:hypothetical protein